MSSGTAGGYHAGFVEMIDLDARWTRRWHNGRRVRPFRFLVDGRLFRLLCAPGQAAALDNFRAAVGRLGLAPEGGLPDLEMTPLAILDVIGVEPPRFPVLPYLPEEPEDKLRAQCRAHKTALCAFLDEISPEELAGDALRPRMRAWTPGWLVPCRADGTLETPVSTGEVPVWAGPSPPAV